MEVPSALLNEFTGRLVVQRVTYQIELDRSNCPAPGTIRGGLQIREYTRGPASFALRELAIAAGAFSRFHRDPAFPEECFLKLYTTWIDRSCRRELADTVLIAKSPAEEEELGMVTIAVEDRVATIGLIAVASSARGQGVGHLLMQAAHQWMVAHDSRMARVVTQLDNRPACRLYESCGYRLEQVQSYYHFWPRNAIRSHGSTISEGRSA